MKNVVLWAACLMVAGFLSLPAAASEQNNGASGDNKVFSKEEFQHAVQAIQVEMDNIFKKFMDEHGRSDWAMRIGTFPAVDVVDSDNQMLIQAELPGVDPRQISASVTADSVIIQGKKPATNGNLTLHEAPDGSFQRTVALPPTADVDNAVAVFNEGLLTITVPKHPAPAEKTRALEIKRVE
jgi:HSP20 family protein